MDPGFLALYKRGNYFKPKLDSLDQRKREERERFAMAAIAFCLKYNHAFRSVFLHVVCGIEKTCRFDDLKIDVEQKPWGDLLLKTKDGIYIIEGKIDAPLQPWQDFGADAFRADGGYGAAIDTAFNNDARRRYYIVLGYSERTLKQPKGKLILCSQKYWEDLERACPQSQSMPFDLADCLAELGVEAFYLRKTKKMKIKNSLEEAGMACEVIAGTFKSLGIKEHKISVTGSYSDRKHWSFGSDLPFPRATDEKRTALVRLKEVVKPRMNDWAIGWFGWEAREDRKWNRYVWFYCGDEKTRNELERHLNRALPKMEYEVRPFVPEDETNKRYVYIAPTEDSKTNSMSDQKWFLSVFEALGITPTDAH